MKSKGDEYTQTAIRTAATGEPTVSTRIDLVLGAGTADDVYLAWHDDGRMYELPIAWLWPLETWGASHFCHEWGEGDFSRTLTVRCLECHNTWIEYLPGTTNQYRRDGAILGVTCERCHGPGREHVAYHQSHPEADSAYAIVQPAGLDRERLIEVCTQCHSNAIAHRRPPFTYQPGEPLEDYFRTLTITRSEDDHVANQIEGLRQSRCFQNSENMTCVTCHDPHKTREQDHSPTTSCRRCHELGDCGAHDRLPVAVQVDCIGCHMPQRIKINVKFETEDDNFVPPIRRFQHRIAIDPTARDEVLLAWRRPQPDAISQAEAARLTQSLVEHWLAQASNQRGQHRYLAAIAAAREALAIDDAPATRETLRELVKIQTRLYDDWAGALHQIALNRTSAAVETLKAMLSVKPDDAEIHSKLGTLYAMAGQKRLAITHLEAVARFDPNNPSGFGVLGKIAFLNGQFEEALDWWGRAAPIDPWNAQIQFDLGQALAALNRPDEAIEHFQQAQVIDPTRVDIRSALAEAEVTVFPGRSSPDSTRSSSSRPVTP
ncbi:MAG: tetratricopeptide repeat protein [Planctomycetaceae bacterium]|nr:tetratricopeptide repeat protein [Planctomycetaceae bacterium]